MEPRYTELYISALDFMWVVPDFVGSQRRFQVVGTHHPKFSGTRWFLIYVNGLAKF
jgi:hypothetical protein